MAIVLVTLTTTVSAQAPQNAQLQHFPIDPAVRMGTLPNGMKYYIYKNDKPKGLADFYIIHNVGAIQEDDSQNGLAHFLEHMAFNGTKNLPGKDMLDYFQANGVEFGRDINAMTGMDDTQYMIQNIPMLREGIIDTAIMAIADWSNGVALLGKEIDNERGVILEEKRTGDTPQRRVQEKMLSVLYNGSKYATRNVIGTEEILKNFKHSEIRDFYTKWYRPDLQAVIVAGDIDVDAIEAKIKKVMGAIPTPKNATPKEVYLLKPYEKDFVKLIQDKESTSSSVLVVSNTLSMPNKYNDTPVAIMKDMINYAAQSIISERYSELSKLADAPFISASMGMQGMTPMNDIFVIEATAKDGQLPRAIEAATKELTRLRKFGVTDDEIERFKSNMLKNVQTEYDNRADRKTKEIIQEIIGNYTKNSPILTPEMSYQLYTSVISQMTKEIVNNGIKQLYVDVPSAIIAMTPDKEGAIPTEASLLAAYNSGKNATVTAPKYEKITRPLLEKQPESVKIKKESKDEMGNTVWTLRNGAKVIVKSTDFRADEIMFTATAKGGFNMVEDSKVISAKMLPNLLGISGLGTFTKTELGKVLTGKSVEASKTISEYSHGIKGESTKSDIKTMFELIYLSYTAQLLPENDFNLLMSRIKSTIENQESQPGYIFQGEYLKALYGDNERVKLLGKDNVNKINLKDIKATNDMLFDGVSGMTFIFTGSIDEKILKPLVEKYIASLPKGGKKHNKATSVKLKEGKLDKKIPVKQISPKVSYNATFYSKDIKDMSLEKTIAASLLNDILQVKYTKSVREELGATYGVGTDVSYTRVPEKRYTISIWFDTNDEKLDAASKQVKKDIEDIINGSNIDEELDIARGAKMKNFEKTVVSSNNAWIQYIHNFNMYGINYPKDYMNTLKSITSNEVRELAKEILAAGNELVVIMTPKK